MILAVALFASQLNAEPHFERYVGLTLTRVPYTAPWGPYRVVVEHYTPANKEEEDGEAPMRCRILDAKGRTLKEVRDYYVSAVETKPITAKGADDLVIHMFSGGAYCCNTEYVFTRRGGLRNVLSFWGRHLSINRIADLDGDGRSEIELDSPILQRFSGWMFSRSYPIGVVLRWNGDSLVDVTRAHLSRSLGQIKFMQKQILDDLKSGKGQKNDQWRWLTEGSVSGYYANMMKIGREKEARAWLMKTLPRSERAWVREYEGELRRLVSQAGKVKLDQRKLIVDGEHM